MNPVDEQISRLARISDESLAGRSTTPGARALLHAILSEDPGEAVLSQGPEERWGSRRRKVVVGMVLAAAVAVGVVVGPAVLPGRQGTATSYANSAIEIEQRGDEWVARVKDPYADYAKYREAFLAVGLDVGLDLVPVSPPRVGQVVRLGFVNTSEQSVIGGAPEPAGCKIGQDGCMLAISVSRHFVGTGTVVLGRPARPGEKYQDAGPATRKGGMLAGFRVDEQRVGTVMAEVRRRGLRATFQVITPQDDGFSVDPHHQPAQVGDDWWVWEAEAEEAGVVRLLVTKKHLAKNPIYGGHKPKELTQQ